TRLDTGDPVVEEGVLTPVSKPPRPRHLPTCAGKPRSGGAMRSAPRGGAVSRSARRRSATVPPPGGVRPARWGAGSALPTFEKTVRAVLHSFSPVIERQCHVTPSLQDRELLWTSPVARDRRVGDGRRRRRAPQRFGRRSSRRELQPSRRRVA